MASYLVLKKSPGYKQRRGRPAELSDLVVDTVDLASREAKELAGDDRVEAVAPVLPLRLQVPTRRSPLTAAEPGATWGVRAVGALQSDFQGRGVKVAILDTGIDADHPAFAGVEIIVQNFTDDVDDDTDGHGTHCAGTIFGQDVNGLRIGVAPGIEQALVGKVIGRDGASTESIVKAIHWAVSLGADIISMSLGIDFPGFVQELISAGNDERVAVSLALEGYLANVDLYRTLIDHLQAATVYQRGAVVVAATGNESDRDAQEPVVLNVTPPATVKGIKAVGAIGESDAGYRVAPFSNANPDVVGPGVDIVSASLGGGLETLDGTSMAAPHVAGVAALWAEQLIQSTGRLVPGELEARLIASASSEGFAPGTEASDIGLGLVSAP